jgi:predicted cytidylate kinase
MTTDKKSIITLTGDLGSGKSTVAQLIAEQLQLQRFSTGDVQRSLAREKGLTSLELNKHAETHPEVDAELDARVAALGETHTRLIIDSRLAWHFVPRAFKVYLAVDPVVAATRILAAQRGAEERYASLEDACAKLAQRRASEELRFQTLYHLDITDFANFDVVVDTTYATPREIAEKVVEQYRFWHDARAGHKIWFHPKRLLPTRDIREIRDEAVAALTSSMHTTGYLSDFPLAILVVDGYYYLYNGHKRASAAITAGIQFCPCTLVAADEGCIFDALEARAFVAAGFTLSRAYDWEAVHDFTFPSYPSV